ncbi:Pleiotrophin-A [Dissostichus eleginoides]|uniref:Midkine n=1 Tax=Dissostichus eleginoides TaxID=100907 RepID=A0AAD9B417_DISEL|nr:Pleiotrophin-A [Dissostichus eleginoides]
MRGLFSVTLLVLLLTLSCEASRRNKNHKGGKHDKTRPPSDCPPQRLSDCKYKFAPWGSCDADTNTKSRSGTLKRALFNAECQPSVTVAKPCASKGKKTRGEKKTN